MTPEPAEFNVVSLPPDFAPGGFRCEPEGKEDEIGEYLSSGTAARDQRVGFSRTYLVFADDPGEPIAYYTLLADAIVLADGESREGIEYRSIPAVKVARLGVRVDCQGQGLGRRART